MRLLVKKKLFLKLLKKKQIIFSFEEKSSRTRIILPHYVSRDLGHRRAEKRTVYVLEDLFFIETLQEWKNVNSIILVEHLIQRDGKETSNNSLFISSLKNISPEKVCEYIRNNCSIENQLHWYLDVTFG